MPTEIELKVKVEDLNPTRQRLRDLSAVYQGQVLELNRFFDTRSSALIGKKRGLRLRTNTNQATKEQTHIITYKGPREPGPLKRREEIEITVDDAASAIQLLEALGFAITLSFEKRRESWTLAGCKVELDELPRLGTFVEVEGPSDAEVLAACAQLKLDDRPTVVESYAKMLARELDKNPSPDRFIRF
jgi:adenylate cyclase class 2